jgi:hypothetical protein
VGLRPATRGAKSKSASRLVFVGAAWLAKASSEGWRLRLRPNNGQHPYLLTLLLFIPYLSYLDPVSPFAVIL